MLEKYPKPEDWQHVRFSDKVHWSIGPEGKLQIIRKPGERYCSDCIQYTTNWEDEMKLSKNGKMSLEVYRDQILEPIVKPWLVQGDDFILEEDNDSGHGGGASKKWNVVKE
ncbi:hypothetical protein EJ02DRAFT_471768 [Clathrospora elynae]|uniref:Uncharacterized protein n=1 Tax=Clathrospora elynae TaxID=706981 RepID=A0A6A5S1L3_9PLEO|nr:hypothetical protein EJ02DRAFT_471768 [Clathrospora elynae]